MSAMRHKGQTARIEYSDADGLFVGCLLGIADVVGFHAASGAWLKLCTPPPRMEPGNDADKTSKRLAWLAKVAMTIACGTFKPLAACRTQCFKIWSFQSA